LGQAAAVRKERLETDLSTIVTADHG